MKSLSYQYPIFVDENASQYQKSKLAFSFKIIAKGIRIAFLSLMIILGIIVNNKVVNAQSNSENESTTQTQENLLKIGSTGEAVNKLQEQLKALTFFTGDTTEYFGTQTQAAVIAFQENNGLSADGVVGSSTMSKLNELVSSGTPSEATSTSSANTTNSNVLKIGSTGEAVKKLQEQLKALTFFTGDTTEYFGTQTQAAVIAFQENNGLSADGVVGSATQNAINKGLENNTSSSDTNSSTTSTVNNLLKRGSQGANVGLLQQQLTQVGVYSGPITNTFGPLTQAAVTSFQENNGLSADGVVGEKTQALLTSKISENTTSPSTSTSNDNNLSTQQIGNYQKQLFTLGYYQGTVDGVIGTGTVNALKQFQAEKNLQVTGTFDSATMEALKEIGTNPDTQQTAMSSYILSDNPSVQEIQLLQRRLQVAGLYNGQIDGVMNQETIEALEKARRSYGINSQN